MPSPCVVRNKHMTRFLQAAAGVLYPCVHTHPGPQLSSMCVCPFFLPLPPLVRTPGAKLQES